MIPQPEDAQKLIVFGAFLCTLYNKAHLQEAPHILVSCLKILAFAGLESTPEFRSSEQVCCSILPSAAHV